MAVNATVRAASPRRRAAGRATLVWAAAAFALAAWPAPAPSAFAAGATGGLGLVAMAPPPASRIARSAAKKAVAKKAPAKKAPAKKAPAKKAPAKTSVAKLAAAKQASAKVAVLGDVGEVTKGMLQQACKGAGLPASGTKAVLLQRYLSALPVAELQAACRKSGLTVGGKRDELVNRLVEEAQSKTVRKAKAQAAGDAARLRSRSAKAMVFRGSLAQTAGGLTKNDIVRSKSGTFVSKKRSEKAKANRWIKAIAAARQALKIKGFAVVGGKTPQGKELYAKAKSLM